MIRKIVIAALLASLFNIVSAIEVSNTQTASYLDEPLRLEADLVGKGEIKLAAPTEYLRFSYPVLNYNVSLDVVGEGEKRKLLLTTEENVDDPSVVILLEGKDENNQVQIFELPVLLNFKPETAGSPSNIEVDDKPTGKVQADTAAEAPKAEGKSQPVAAKASDPVLKRYGPVKPGETLWSIANRLKSKNITVKQMQDDIRKRNPKAFANDVLLKDVVLVYRDFAAPAQAPATTPVAPVTAEAKKTATGTETISVAAQPARLDKKTETPTPTPEASVTNSPKSEPAASASESKVVEEDIGVLFKLPPIDDPKDQEVAANKAAEQAKIAEEKSVAAKAAAAKAAAAKAAEEKQRANEKTKETAAKQTPAKKPIIVSEPDSYDEPGIVGLLLDNIIYIGVSGFALILFILGYVIFHRKQEEKRIDNELAQMNEDFIVNDVPVASDFDQSEAGEQDEVVDLNDESFDFSALDNLVNEVYQDEDMRVDDSGHTSDSDVSAQQVTDSSHDAAVLPPTAKKKLKLGQEKTEEAPQIIIEDVNDIPKETPVVSLETDLNFEIPPAVVPPQTAAKSQSGSRSVPESTGLNFDIDLPANAFETDESESPARSTVTVPVPAQESPISSLSFDLETLTTDLTPQGTKAEKVSYEEENLDELFSALQSNSMSSGTSRQEFVFDSIKDNSNVDEILGNLELPEDMDFFNSVELPETYDESARHSVKDEISRTDTALPEVDALSSIELPDEFDLSSFEEVTADSEFLSVADQDMTLSEMVEVSAPTVSEIASAETDLSAIPTFDSEEGDTTGEAAAMPAHEERVTEVEVQEVEEDGEYESERVKLELAETYINHFDASFAKPLLQEVIRDGSKTQAEKAKALLSKIQ